jgi:hypothetical protein
MILEKNKINGGLDNMEQPDYKEQVNQNEKVFRDVAKNLRPDIFSVMDTMDTYNINYIVLLKIMEHLNKIGTGTKFGNLTVEIQDGIVTFVRSLESSRLNESVLKSS